MTQPDKIHKAEYAAEVRILWAYLIRTSGVPLSYHHLQNVEKTKGLHVPLEYHYSTSIFHFDPKTTIDKISTTS